MYGAERQHTKSKAILSKLMVVKDEVKQQTSIRQNLC